MTGNQTRFEAFLAEEANKYKGVSVPVRSGLFRRAIVRKIRCKKLHPNPGDEFCNPRIGPNYEIVSRYEHEIWAARKRRKKDCFSEPLIVEKIRPEGYLLLNGHHRWAAAVRMGVARVPVKIVNLTQEMDVRRMLQNARHSKRVTLDLDEVVFTADPQAPAEKPLPFPLRKIYRERLRLGVPALFHDLKINGYDIWVYSAGYDSLDYVRAYFKWHRIPVDGIVTGTGRKSPVGKTAKNTLETLMKNKYPETVHIDSHSVLRIQSQRRDYQEFPLSGSRDTWSREIMEIMGKWEKPEG